MSMLISQGRNGKTESFYYSLSVYAALAAGQLLAAKRSLLMTATATIFDIVVRDVTNPRVSAVTDASWFEDGKRPTAETGDVHNAAALVRYTAGRHSAKPWLHCMPDDFIQGSATTGSFFLTATAVGLVNAYLTFLLGQNTWQLKGYAENTTIPPALNVDNITIVSGNIVMSVPGAVYPDGTRIVISGCKGYRANQFNGVWKIATNTAGSLVVSSTKRIDPNFFYERNSGKARNTTPEYVGLSAAQTIRAGTKKMGRIPNVPAGRRSARR
jgi:hypothetical protein